MICCNCSDPCEKDPNFECLRVLRTRKHSKFGNFLTMAEQLRFVIRLPVNRQAVVRAVVRVGNL